MATSKINLFMPVNITTTMTNVQKVISRLLLLTNKTLSLSLTIDSGISGSVKVAIVPSNCKPSLPLGLSVAPLNGGDANTTLSAFVNNEDGAIYVRSSATTVGTLYVSGSWMLP